MQDGYPEFHGFTQFSNLSKRLCLGTERYTHAIHSKELTLGKIPALSSATVESRGYVLDRYPGLNIMDEQIGF